MSRVWEGRCPCPLPCQATPGVSAGHHPSHGGVAKGAWAGVIHPEGRLEVFKTCH